MNMPSCWKNLEESTVELVNAHFYPIGCGKNFNKIYKICFSRIDKAN